MTANDVKASLKDDRILTIDQVMYDNKALYENLRSDRGAYNSNSPRKQGQIRQYGGRGYSGAPYGMDKQDSGSRKDFQYNQRAAGGHI